MNKILSRSVTTLVLVGAAAGLIAAGHPDVTRPRLEESLLQVYPNLYVQHARILGDNQLTRATMATTVSCKRGGPTTKDSGPGSDWRCFLDYNDEQGTRQQKVLMEVTAKSNSCYVATAPSAVVGLLRLTDTHGRNVLNPVFEYDACYSPTS